jgi:hypothetical protein
MTKGQARIRGYSGSSFRTCASYRQRQLPLLAASDSLTEQGLHYEYMYIVEAHATRSRSSISASSALNYLVDHSVGAHETASRLPLPIVIVGRVLKTVCLIICYATTSRFQ